MQTKSRLILRLAVVALSLAGCGKPKSDQVRPPKTSATGSVVAGAAKSPDQIAAALMAARNGFAIQEFAIQTPMSCFKPDGETWVLTCRVVLSDAKRDGRPAAVDVQIYDHDVTFADEVPKVKQRIVGMQGQGDSLIVYTPEFSSDDPQGHKQVFETRCHQIQGAKNSPVYCGMLVSPRIFVMSGVTPAEASTRDIVISAEGADDSDSSSGDAHHGADLAFIGLVVASSAK